MKHRICRISVKTDRSAVPAEDITGNWQDSNSSKYYLNIADDGTVTSAQGDGTYTIYEDESAGTCIEITLEVEADDGGTETETTEYAVLPYEGYLFLHLIGGYAMYQLEPEEE